ncbi:hypothetical protein [Chryseolinea lacunae]|uniref:DUF4359 domain-containing protein n=1 Tax=Chryseolinea lacunae TaxID=2801331 RepID=A0ABS1KPS7_9BACT|nr:hypothetical protein [Chryseolinea lacunae]MBL0741475.1 hypothetical protein [Chryseolinea lacunae]
MMDWIFDHITGKLLWASLFVLGGTSVVITRFVISRIEKNTALKAIEKIKTRPSYAKEIADSLDIPYGQKPNFSLNHFEILKSYIRDRAQIGEYKIIYTTEVTPSDLLVFTRISFVDFDVNVMGQASDVKKDVYVTFLVRYDHEDQQFLVQSNLHYTSTEKFHRDRFTTAIFTGI